MNNENRLSLLNEIFDNIYVLNLKKDVIRMNSITNRLNKCKIKFERFEGINGRDKRMDYMSMLKKKWSVWERIQFRNNIIQSIGAYGCVLSHKEIIRDAKNKGYKKILILEDDAIPHNNLEERLILNSNILKQNWKSIYLGSTQGGWHNIHIRNGYYIPNNVTWGAFAYGLDNSVFNELLTLMEYPKFPIDKYLHYLYRYNASPVIYPQLFIAKLDNSNIRDSRNINIYSKIFKWDLKNFKLN